MLNIWGDGATWIAGVEWLMFVFEFFTFFWHQMLSEKPDKGLCFFKDSAFN
jgi:hypothetical protein